MAMTPSLEEQDLLATGKVTALATSHPAIILHEGAVEQLRQAKGLLHAVLVQTKAGVPLQAELLADIERMANG